MADSPDVCEAASLCGRLTIEGELGAIAYYRLGEGLLHQGQPTTRLPHSRSAVVLSDGSPDVQAAVP